MDAQGSTVAAVHRYRYLANLATFHTHLWLANPDRINDKKDLQKAIAMINQALSENPNAHFGREVYHLVLLDWYNGAKPKTIRPRSTVPPGLRRDWTKLDHFYVMVESTQAQRGKGGGVQDALSGLAGLVHLGSAWELIDVYMLIHTGLNQLSKWSLAELRALELFAMGKEPYYPDQFSADDLVNDRLSGTSLTPKGKAEVAAFFKEVRQAAEQRKTARDAYMEERFKRGEHPDTHPDFWSQWREPAMPKYPN